MDVKEFLEKTKRMCEYYDGDCKSCPLKSSTWCALLDDCNDENEINDIVSIVENWEESENTNSTNTVQNWFNDIDIALTNMDKSINELAKRMANLENRMIRSVDDFR
jgi:uncharacterized protein YbaP (TraB family)